MEDSRPWRKRKVAGDWDQADAMRIPCGWRRVKEYFGQEAEGRDTRFWPGYTASLFVGNLFFSDNRGGDGKNRFLPAAGGKDEP